MTTNRESGNGGKSFSPSFLETSASLHQLQGAHLEPGVLTSSSAKAPWTVEGAVAKLPGGTPVADSSSPVPFFHMLERLKTTKREGWRRSGIPQYVLPNLLPSSKLTTSQISRLEQQAGFAVRRCVGEENGRTESGRQNPTDTRALRGHS